ncbi:MAG: hypothetical protein WC489_05505 [Patescibacteria group bacterium]
MKKYLAFFIISLLIFSYHFAKTKHGVYGDGNGYFSLAHTFYFQKDLHFEPIYRHLSQFKGSSYTFSRIFWDTGKTQTGNINCPWLIGTALFWFPSFALIDIFTGFFQISTDMFHPAYEFGCGMTGIILVIIGLILIEKILISMFDSKAASQTVIATYVSTQLLYYASFEPALSHQVTFFLFSLFLFTLQKTQKTIRSCLILGLSAGLIFITRIGDVVLLLPFVFLKIVFLYKLRKYKGILLFLLAFSLAALPQLIFQQLMYGNFMQSPYLLDETTQIKIATTKALYNHLFGVGGGLFIWSPLLGAAIVGLVKLTRSRKLSGQSKVYLLSFTGYSFFVASWSAIAPVGFGNRFFISVLPFMTIGLAHMFKSYEKNVRLFSMFCMVWNALLLVQFYFDRVRMVDREGLTYANLITGQITVFLELLHQFRI